MNKTVLSLRFDHSLAFLTVVNFGKKTNTINDAFSIRLSLPFEIINIDDTLNTITESLEQNLSEFLKDIDEMHISFSMQSSIFKTIIVDELSDNEISIEQIKWEFSQVTQVPMKDFVINLPDSKDHNSQRTIIAMRKKLINFSNIISETLGLPISKIGLNLLNLTKLIPEQNDFNINENYLVINRGKALTEVGTYYDNLFRKTHNIPAKESGNINQLNLQMRSIIDIYKNAYKEVLFDRIYVCGSATELNEADMIANVLQIPVTILKIPSSFEFDESLNELKEDPIKQSEYIINISSLMD